MPAEEQCPFEPELRRLLEEELSAAEEEKLAAHLRECSACRAALDELTHQDNLFADAIRQATENRASPEAELVQMIQRLRAQIPRENNEATTEMPVETGQAAAATSSQMSLEFLTPSSLPQCSASWASMTSWE
jgi:predicted anti-sigma-YlaC factor YlaD